MTRKDELVARALKAAMRARTKGRKPLNEPICPFDLATETYKIDVRFEPRASLEGMYCQEPLAIIIGSKRPAGRQTFTCAHELGHHVFKHGTKVDDLEVTPETPTDDPDEFVAQVFAGFLLMPKMAVCMAFKKFRIDPKTASTSELYSLSCYFGVGFTSFVNHLSMSLRLISFERANALKNTNLSQIRAEFGAPDITRPLIIAQEFSRSRAIDAEVGDIILTSSDALHEGLCLIPLDRNRNGCFWEAVRQGRSRIDANRASAFVRVRPKEFLGRAIFRHEPDDEK